MTGIVTFSDVWPFYNTSEVFRATTHLKRVVFPTQQYVEHVRDKHKDWQDKVLKGSEKFLEVCIDCNTAQTTVSMKEDVCLAEDFVLFEAVETKWSNESRYKCSCPLFLIKGQCKHIVVLAMLADPTTVLLPKKSYLRQIRSRAGKKRGKEWRQ